MENHKKISITNLLITVLVCSVFTILNLYTDHSVMQTATQTVNINAQQKEKIDLNTASLEQIKSLPNIGDKLAKKIVDNRPYKSIWDLQRIDGIGDATIKILETEVYCSGS